MALFTFSGMCHSRYLRENLRCAYCHAQPYMALSRTEHALCNYSISYHRTTAFIFYPFRTSVPHAVQGCDAKSICWMLLAEPVDSCR